MRKIEDIDISSIMDYSLDISSRTIYLNSEEQDNDIYDVNINILSRFVKCMDILNSLSTNKITIKSTNSGGDFDYGLAMYDCIKQSKSKVDYIIYGLACSMGAVIPQAASNRIMFKNASMMVHHGQYSIANNVKAANSEIVYYNGRNSVMPEILASRCVNGEFFKNKKYTVQDTKKYIVEKLSKVEDWWMSSSDALYYGFVDKVI